MPQNIFFINGKFVKEKDAKISVFDLGLLRSYGVFTFLRTFNGKPFNLDVHIKRLKKSARRIGIKNSYTEQFLKKTVFNLLKKNKHLKEANIRIVLTGGTSKDGITPGKPSLIIIATPVNPWPENIFKNGAKLMFCSSKRILPEVKSLVYTEAVKALQDAKSRGALEILYFSDENEILECATSNFFAVKENKIITPPNGKILAGVTRNIVMGLAKNAGYKVYESKIQLKDISKFDEAFITASSKNIIPIVQIDKFKIGNGKVGPTTKKLMQLFKEMTNGY